MDKRLQVREVYGPLKKQFALFLGDEEIKNCRSIEVTDESESIRVVRAEFLIDTFHNQEK